MKTQQKNRQMTGTEEESQMANTYMKKALSLIDNKM